MHSVNLHTLDLGQVHFGFDLAPEVDGLLQRAAASVSDREASIAALEAARQLAPDSLDVLQALYKFHCYRGDLKLAHEIVCQSLAKAAEQGGFSPDWTLLTPFSADWNQPRGASRSFLYSLKALAFIRLRDSATDEAQKILAVLHTLDPEDKVGAQVVRELAERLAEDDDG